MGKRYRIVEDERGGAGIEVSVRGTELLADPILNRGTAFTHEQRRQLGLEGLLPNHVSTFEEQLERAYGNISRKTLPLERYIGLSELKARNATLFFRLLAEHVEEFLPVIYTPTVGDAAQNFSRIFRRSWGLWITPDHQGHIDEVLANAPYDDVRLIVVTDNERILGLGDQGAGGIAIPVGKLELYTVAAGISPAQVLPVSLDVGTDNSALRGDHLYAGWRGQRLRGPQYDALVEEFVEAVRGRFPDALLQWEDFKKANAFDLLGRYRKRLLSFNDDIQGTAGIALAGILAAGRISGTPLARQRVLIMGAGAAGIGIGHLLRDAMRREGLDGDELTRAVAVLDSRGLIVEGSPSAEGYKAEFAWPRELVAGAGLTPDQSNGLHACIEALRPTVLIGTTGQPGAFDESAIRAMAGSCERPVIFPFSNPTSKSEACPADLLAWTDGRALMATGSPFEPARFGDDTMHVAQGNNAYIFPGVGLGALVVRAREVTDSMFSVAARTLADQVDDAGLERGALFPPLARIRELSALIARAVATEAVSAGVAAEGADAPSLEQIEAMMWVPEYHRLVPA